MALTAGVIPAGTKISVRKTSWNHIYVEITAWEGSVLNDAYLAHLLDPTTVEWDRMQQRDTLVGEYPLRFDGCSEYRPEVNMAIVVLRIIANRHNYDHSDYQSDLVRVGYYLDVTARPVECAQREAIRLESNPVYAAKLHAAKIAAASLGPKCVRSVCGKRGIDACGEWALDDLLRVAARANGRPVVYDKSARAWLPVDATDNPDGSS